MRPILLADENIAGLDKYLANSPFDVITMAGRDIAKALPTINPTALWLRSVTPINAQTLPLNKDSKLSFVGTATLGTDHIDTSLLQNKGIYFASAAGSSRHSVAQYVLTAILTLRPTFIHQPTPPTIGIIGLGNIGATLTDYVQQLGWSVAGYDPFLPKSAINNSSFENTLQADVLSIHTPLTQAGEYPTHHLIDAHALALMPPTTLLINAARGRIIDETALICDLKNTNRQVVLDVFYNEPIISATLLSLITLATPHIAGYSLDGKLRGTDMIYQAFCRWCNVRPSVQLEELLPPNPYHFRQLHQALLAGDFELLSHYYNLKKDHQALLACNHNGIGKQDFDNLRKNYPLRREWLI